MSGAEGWFDERVDDLQQGVDDLAAGDEIRQTNQLLAILVRQMTDESADNYFLDGFEPSEPGESDEGRTQATYSSQEGITAADDVERVNFGLKADTVVLRNITDTLGVAFKDPARHDDAVITVEPADSPFVLSGVHGIAASSMWYESGSTSSHDFDLLAVKRTGR